METYLSGWQWLGVLVALIPSYFVWGRWRTRNWLTTVARVVEIPRDNPDGWFARYQKYDKGADLGIEYEVDGQSYRQNPNIEVSLKVDGLAATSYPTVPDEFDVRYYPENPNRYSVVHAYRWWYLAMTTACCVGIGIAIVYAAA